MLLQPPPLAVAGSRDELERELATRFDVAERGVAAGGHVFSFLVIRDPNRLVDELPPERFAEDERFPYWAEVWPSSVELARFCLQEAPPAGLRVLELGCGLGLGGIAAARAGGRVTMTDIDEDALLFARCNALRNLERAQMPLIRRLDWRQPCLQGLFDLILGADIVYERRHYRPVIDLIGRHLRPGGCAVITDPGRSTGEQFVDAARAAGLAARVAATPVVAGARTVPVMRATLTRETGGGGP